MFQVWRILMLLSALVVIVVPVQIANMDVVPVIVALNMTAMSIEGNAVVMLVVQINKEEYTEHQIDNFSGNSR